MILANYDHFNVETQSNILQKNGLDIQPVMIRLFNHYCTLLFDLMKKCECMILIDKFERNYDNQYNLRSLFLILNLIHITNNFLLQQLVQNF